MGNLTDLFPAATSNNILEVLAGTCDGRSVSVGSGAYTFPNVTGIQNISTSVVNVTGSSIDYVPPEGTKYVSYKFNTKYEATSAGGIMGINIVYDNTVITQAARGFSGNYMGGTSHDAETTISMEFVFDLTVPTTNKAAGQIAPADWTAAKTIKCTARSYSSTYLGRFHGNTYFDGASASSSAPYVKPNLTITAYS